MKNIPIIFLLFFSCSGFLDENHTHIDPLIKPHFDAFVYEAKSRGITLNTSNITMSFKNLDACGLTVYDINTIYIDSTRSCWMFDQREVVFHELGHFMLHRIHDNTMIDGRYKSIMTGEGYILDMEKNAKYYYDELFTSNRK